MRILVCAAAAPAPPITGSRLALRALLEELGRDHEIHVLAFRASGQQPPVGDRPLSLVEPPPAGLVRRAGTHLGALARGRPCDVDRLAAAMMPPLAVALDAFGPDIVHVAAARLAALGRKLTDRPSVIVPLDAAHLGVQARALASTGLMRRYLLAETRRMMDFEAAEYRRFGRVVV